MIGLTEFSLRHFKRNFAGTKILNMTSEEFLSYINHGTGSNFILLQYKKYEEL